jgi:succinyl-CoA synthetase beta subunit
MVVSICSVEEGSMNRMADLFLGIVRCDMIAESIIAAANEIGGFKIPVVVRLQGTNSDKGLKLVRLYSMLERVSLMADLDHSSRNRDWIIYL